MMSQPSCGEAAYRAYCEALGLPPGYTALSRNERLAWGSAAAAAVQEALATPSSLQRQAALARLPCHTQTPRAQREFLQQEAPLGLKVCADCLVPQGPSAYYHHGKTRDGLDTYCKTCRRRKDNANYRQRKAGKRSPHPLI